MKVIHNKLVRDHIPDIIHNSNKICQTRILDENEYMKCLKEKLIEETNEVNAANNNEELINELGDVLEVIDALINASNISIDDVIQHKNMKANKNGKFDKKIFLEWVDDNNG